jgi:hypothetical protein
MSFGENRFDANVLKKCGQEKVHRVTPINKAVRGCEISTVKKKAQAEKRRKEAVHLNKTIKNKFYELNKTSLCWVPETIGTIFLVGIDCCGSTRTLIFIWPVCITHF